MIFGHQAEDHTKQNEDQHPAGSPAGSSFIVGAAPVDTITPSAPPTPTPPLSTPPTDATDTEDDVAPSILEQALPEPTVAESTVFGNVGLADEFKPSPEPLSPPPTPVKPSMPVAEPDKSDKTDDGVDETEADTEIEAFDSTDTPHADLLVLKQQALSDLSPLVGQLEQTPEERFRTTMMMIQSTDNQALIKDAYAAAHAIEDDKIRAQALLDVVNEINYFTQKANEN